MNGGAVGFIKGRFKDKVEAKFFTNIFELFGNLQRHGFTFDDARSGKKCEPSVSADIKSPGDANAFKVLHIFLVMYGPCLDDTLNLYGFVTLMDCFGYKDIFSSRKKPTFVPINYIV